MSPVSTRNGNGPSPPMQTLATITARPTTLIGTTDAGPGCGAQDFSNTGSCMPATTGGATGAGGSLPLHPVKRATTVMTTSACRALSPAPTTYDPSSPSLSHLAPPRRDRPPLFQPPPPRRRTIHYCADLAVPPSGFGTRSTSLLVGDLKSQEDICSAVDRSGRPLLVRSDRAVAGRSVVRTTELSLCHRGHG